MITYIGNKRKLVDTIENVIKRLKPKSCADAFVGSGVVSRMLLTHCEQLHVNDLEKYCETLSTCFLKTPSRVDQEDIIEHIKLMNVVPDKNGLITELYSPNVNCDRCFYTPENARRIDAMMYYIQHNVPDHLKSYCLGPLIVKASIHTNTSGVFKGFHKGGWGGKGGHAQERIMKRIEVESPMWIEGHHDVHVHRKDACDFLRELPKVDLIYLDPPYNQHPYGSNYFMLNLICTNERPHTLSKVSGIPVDWNRSQYNYKKQIKEAMELTLRLASEKAKHTLVSYSNEGFITPEEWTEMLKPYNYEKIEIDYNCYRGSRNLQNRSTKVTEFLFVISSS
jgi:adenine-specific DNA-methyltransferase|tara:strand:+ start:883 stop:1893 length:1011 start_codon:yes stop_codon:yes gene_type:complete